MEFAIVILSNPWHLDELCLFCLENSSSALTGSGWGGELSKFVAVSACDDGVPRSLCHDF